MIEGFILSITREAMVWVILISAPPLIAAMVVGVSISIVQATTQVQDQTLTFVPKIIAVFGTMALIGPWAMSQMVNFATTLIERFPEIIH